MRKTEQELKAEAQSYHEAYSVEGAGSPEYQTCVRRFGRMLTASQVEDILSAHSISIEELVNDEHDPILPEGGKPQTLDAALLYAWLGY